MDIEIKIYGVVIKSSENVQNGVERGDLYQKRFRSVDKLESIIHKVE